MAGDVVELPSTQEWVARICSDFKTLVSLTLQKQHRFRWVLSGGQTPTRIYEALAKTPYVGAIAWDKIDIFWGDERLVPPTDPESNYRAAMGAFLSRVPVNSSAIYRMPGEESPEVAREHYENELRLVFGSQARWPTFDLAFMGLGDDGHTASLFPGDSTLKEKNKWVLKAQHPKTAQPRLTLTIPVFNHTPSVWFLVSGEKKRKALEASVRQPADPRWPASYILKKRMYVQWSEV